MPWPATPIDWLILAWLAALGACIGSFLNVVVYRVPAGMSLLRPGSHCPACKHPIRWHDNVPVLGWLWLGGRCRDCRVRISVRYPVVEVTTAALFAWLGWAEGLSWAANLPPRAVPAPGGLACPSLGFGQVAGLLVYHLVLLTTLLAAALIDWDRKSVPLRIALPALVVGLAAPIFWPYLHPVPASAGLGDSLAGLIDGLAGMAVGLAWGMIAEFTLSSRRDRGAVAAWTCMGVYLGWQAAAALGFVAFAAGVVVAGARARRPAWLAGLALATPLWLVLWAHLVAGWPALGR
jgi:leader peptidase (prepilin peptidase)/N-methyltransferase